MANSDLIAQPLNAPNIFNWVLLIELLVCCVLTVFFLAYFNRLFATLVSYGIRSYTWRYFHAHVDIQSLTISLLGGRIFFKGIRYHAHNETILVHSGYITWHYWYRKVRDAQILAAIGPGAEGSRSRAASSSSPRSRSVSPGRQERGGSHSNQSLPCRLNVQLEGVQAFFYNRSPAYDAIIDQVNKATGEANEDLVQDESRAFSSGTDSAMRKHSAFAKLGTKIRSSVNFSDGRDYSKGDGVEEKYSHRQNVAIAQPVIPAWLQLFPVHVGCKIAAAVIGNENTKNIITVKVDSAAGSLDAADAGPLDLYRLISQFDFQHPVVHMRANPDFKELQLTTAVHLKSESIDQPDETDKGVKGKSTKKNRPWYQFGHRPNESSESVRATSAAGKRHASVAGMEASLPGEGRWQGLSRYLVETLYNEHDEWDAVEYGRSSLLADCPRIGFTYYWDTAGPVPDSVDSFDGGSDSNRDDINGSSPPEYGMDVQIYGGTINYGPWADRQRMNFQSVFFPGSCVDSLPAKKLLPGELRISTLFKLFVSIEADTTLRIPVRETSKDWKWKGKAETVTGQGKEQSNRRKSKSSGKRVPFWRPRDEGKSGPNVRPFAWLDIKISRNTTVNYVMDMVARGNGYRSDISADVRGLEIYTSVNHGLLWRSGVLTLECDLSAPLGWNAMREWRFKIVNDDLELFILRDHLFLLTDLITDWTAGPLPDYYTFTPFRYLLDARFHNFKMYLNTNDSNIINDPADFDENQFFILQGRELSADVIIPSEQFRPIQNEIFFDVTCQNVDLQLCFNAINTVAAFVGPKKIATLEEVTFKGSHTLFTQTSSELTDRLIFNVHGSKLKMYLFGFVMDRLIKLKENYFGEDLHFRTLDEFQDISHGRASDAETDAKSQQSNRSNDLDVILCISVEDVLALLPANVYSAEQHIAINIPYASADLRITSPYMDLAVDLSPMTFSHSNVFDHDSNSKLSSSGPEIFVDSAHISGHRLFGLPPTEPVYVNNWNIKIGDISGECSSAFFEKLARAIQCFTFTLDDDENSMPLVNPLVIPEVTFLRIRTHDVRVWLHVGKDAVLVSTGPASINLNDWVGATFSDRLRVFVPNLTVACVDANSASRHGTRSREVEPVKTFAHMKTTLSMDILKRKLHFTEAREKQQIHLLESDSRTHRTTFLLLERAVSRQSLQRSARDSPALAYPPVPAPILLRSDSSFFEYESVGSSNHLRGSSSTANVSDMSFKKRTRSLQSSRSSLVASIHSGSWFGGGISRNSSRRPAQGSPRSAAGGDISRNRLIGERERERRDLAPSSFAFASSLAMPYFPLQLVEADHAELPLLPKKSTRQPAGPVAKLSAATDQELSEDFAHTSVIISTDPGIQLFFSPRAITAVVGLVELFQPKSPQNLLDAFQINVVSELLGDEKRKMGAGSSVEISVRIPALGARFLNEFDDGLGIHAGIDQHDLDLADIAFFARHTKHPIVVAKTDTMLLHCTFKSLDLSVLEKMQQDGPRDIAFRARVNDVLLWMGRFQKLSLNLSFRNLDITAASVKADYLASMVHRTTIQANHFAAEFAALHDAQKNRLSYLAYSLTMGGGDVADPPFLMRTSHLLRIAPHHLRNHDSWKILSRFRYIYQNMTTEGKDGLNYTSLCPSNAAALVLNSWDQWRSWDLAHVKTSVAMRQLYESPAELLENGLPTKPVLPIEVTVRSASIGLIVDPGQYQSEVTVKTLTMNFMIVSPSAAFGVMPTQADKDNLIDSILFQVGSSAIAAKLNWEIIGLAENVAKIFKDGEHLETIDPEPSVLSASDTPTSHVPKMWREIQGVVAIESAIFGLDTPNLSAIVESEDFKLSLISNDKTSTDDGLFLSALLHATANKNELRSNSRVLARTWAECPNLYISQDVPGRNSHEQTEWRVAGTSSNIMIEGEEELLGLVEIVDLVISTEAVDLQRRFAKLRLPNSTMGPGVVIEKSERLPKLTVALVLDTYRVDLALLQSLTYSFSGKVGRVSVVPDLHQSLSLHVDLDLDGHAHDLISHDKSGSHVISTLRLPPINAHVNIHQTKDRLYLTVSAIIETVSLEASAVHGLFNTLNRPEIVSTFQAVQADVGTLKQHIQDAFPSVIKDPAPLEHSPGQTLAYNIALTLVGIKINADAPGSLPNAGVARLSLGLNAVHLQASNIAEDNLELLPLAEIHAKLRQLFIELVISDSSGARRCGNLSLSASVHLTRRHSLRGQAKRSYRANVDDIVINVFAETASAVVDVLNHLQDRLKDLDLSREKRYLQRLRQPSRKSSMYLGDSSFSLDSSLTASGFLQSDFSLSLRDMQLSWIVGNSVPAFSGHEAEDLMFFIKLINLSTRSENSSNLHIQEVLLQMVPVSHKKQQRSRNSALLPEVMFNVGYASTEDQRKLSFQAVGKSLEVLLDSKFMIPASILQRSIGLAVDKFREATASWEMIPTSTGKQRKNPFGDKRLASLLVDAEFAGAVVRLQGRGRTSGRSSAPEGEKPHQSRYGQFVGEEHLAGAELHTPGIAVKIEYTDNGLDSSVNAEMKVNGSSNELTPTVVPLILELSDSIKTVVGDTESKSRTPTSTEPKSGQTSSLIDEGLLTADPSKLLGKTSFNLGVRIRRQEFSLSCQPIARVEASAYIEDIYITANTVKAAEHDHFIAVSANFQKLRASIQHIYSRESTFSFEVESIVLSIMNSKHLSGTAGLSAVLKINPMRTQINARQLQDFLLFREIWLPAEIRNSASPSPASVSEPQDYLVQRYQQVASATAFPWTATVAIAELKVELDLGQAIGKSNLVIEDVWASSRKDSSWEQNLCIGVGKVGIDNTGRMSGFVELAGVKVRTMIAWPKQDGGHRQTPSIQASAGFERLRVKGAFDYQAFAIADVAEFNFVMYNIRPDSRHTKDRLVAILDGDKVNVFCTATSASQGLALFQALERLVQENQAAYAQSLKEVEKFLRRESAIMPTRFGPKIPQDTILEHPDEDEDVLQAPISLYTDVVVAMRSIHFGVFPSAFFDNQVFIIEASDVQARFAATLDQGKVHCGLGTTLGQLQVALTTVANPTGPKTLPEITVDDIVSTATMARGGTILRVPKVIATMQTWQTPASYSIDYVFKSRFEGKVDVGWNYSRISFIRGMYDNHARSLASRLGKPLAESAVKITTGVQSGTSASKGESRSEPQAGIEGDKITAVVNVPQSKYEYHALEPTVIETPQLRELGEATPPLEWIGLQRDRLPNVTHQIVIVALLGVAKEVEDAYGSILGRT